MRGLLALLALLGNLICPCHCLLGVSHRCCVSGWVVMACPGTLALGPGFPELTVPVHCVDPAV
ncbi:hypothetical protein COCSUDRAFT_32522 [Coccomyxa subellipsoidea C-169]|uniref:Uncharacterized protein n=1 Tax=Coccomyxa subellipsoidea (strain C-169) TaxID=574566 RepID=I0YSX0_COCSC|nr:hypothetical protein COCSUDRAFT_33682 [Coccomyxa subellipsoidea C-169]XP_005650467.1 hypothetical protein COCSUDRAFT_32424 [Coccomyxa subellipsoidea C-169]XP_005650767.1 hypothetical protein COCSUDRAFT_32522 [Coccomyxa subellipsoidea C-169]EIE21489.1 hypothetical protein COCSUDRAFT_33682 [Coccomyxa subellipsoidea C-169]EIE25923.1 hypothetical protein COCSUDRAFT_32424 [Coccomyxa subellipsoidea C-169]EIE26223.1 hypothetical protein COCSUDRAFT_32522 [Coccomyxa subellipsoidea C-169]|eukprot:XP_005646033.1 hypothetical protein COCSUDRAFT_33682 [Coccomyxa subellipsoidea C-169]